MMIISSLVSKLEKKRRLEACFFRGQPMRFSVCHLLLFLSQKITHSWEKRMYIHTHVFISSGLVGFCIFFLGGGGGLIIIIELKNDELIFFLSFAAKLFLPSVHPSVPFVLLIHSKKGLFFFIMEHHHHHHFVRKWASLKKQGALFFLRERDIFEEDEFPFPFRYSSHLIIIIIAYSHTHTQAIVQYLSRLFFYACCMMSRIGVMMMRWWLWWLAGFVIFLRENQQAQK